LEIDLRASFFERRVTTSGTTRNEEAEVAEIGIKELKATASAVIDRVEDGAAFVVTRRGRPAAVLMPVEEAEDLVLANADEYVRMRRAARAAYAAGRTVDLAELA
jgi:prevent-host-death family protein